MTGRLPAHLEVAAIRRLAEAQGGFATVLARGEHDAGTVAIVMMCRNEVARLYERMPQMDGNRSFVPTLVQDAENEGFFSASLQRRTIRDPDLWLIEVDIPDIERFVAALPT